MKFYKVRLFNERGEVLFDSDFQGLIVGENSISNVLDYTVTMANMRAGSEAVITPRKLDGGDVITGTQIVNSFNDQELIVMINKTSQSTFDVKYIDSGRLVNPSSGSCPAGQKTLEGKCLDHNLLQSVNPGISDFEIHGVRFVIDFSRLLEDSPSYYRIIYDKAEVAQSASTPQGICSTGTEYTVIVSIHDARDDGTGLEYPSKDNAGQDLIKTITVPIKCFENVGSGATTTQQASSQAASYP